MEGHRKVNRRSFLSAALVGLTAKAEKYIDGSYVNEAFPLGHRLRDHQAFRRAADNERIPVVIVGGGIAGLSAAWRLQKKGFREFILLEMDAHAGGNARWGENAITRFPWAAHYVPVPNPESILVKELFEDLGILENGKPKEEMLCFSLKERLFLHGQWQEGLEPDSALTPQDREQFRRFESMIQRFRASGAFTIPMEIGSSKAENHSDLDSISFASWLDGQRFTSPSLRWYTEYACRDDFGALARCTSAWAGIHYFAARPKEETGPITAPEGNGWIVERLLQKLQQHIITNSVVYRIERLGNSWIVRTPQRNYRTDAVIFTAPTFIAAYIIESTPRTIGFVYSPWFTANLTLDYLPREGGVELAWDNVFFDSASLGYVDAMHMSLRSHVDRTVWTYYWSLAEHSPEEGRRLLLRRSWSEWKEIIFQDLERAHPDIRQCVTRIDMMRMGHAMARPIPGFVTSAERREWLRGKSGLYFANSDLSGFSIFEEAQYRGVCAADKALQHVGMV
jgi:glycine/D-amino acid oxidase-like deaminating enzyme